MLGLNLKFENCLIQSKLCIQQHIIAGVDSSAISSPNLEELDCPNFISLQSIVCERHCATSNFAAGRKHLGAQHYLYIVTLKSRLKKRVIWPTQERRLGTRNDVILNHPSHMISQKSGFDGYIIGQTQVSQPLSCPD